MKKIFFYTSTFFGILILAFGVFLTANEMKEIITYSSLQKANPNITILDSYGTPVKSYLNEVWKTLIIWALFTLFGWAIIYYADKFLNTKRRINENFATAVVLIMLILPIYYFF